ncbi:MAG: mercury(II) reductase [Planctomycetota bacterium]|nr:MAG: mercury(II) reductase [Planctomycetota bacterium]
MSQCCGSRRKKEFHLIILGGGSAAFSAALKTSELGGKATIINAGLPIGGTCVNVGCVPSKNLIRAAEYHYHANHSPFQGIRAQSKVEDFKALMSEKENLVLSLRQAKYLDVIQGNSRIQIIEGWGRLVNPNTVEVNGDNISGDGILIATGASPYIPPIPGIDKVPYLTNEDLFQLGELPESMIVLGGRYIALESAQTFGRFGTKITILQRSSRILPQESADITHLLTQYMEEEGISVITGVQFQEVSQKGENIQVKALVNGKEKLFEAEKLLVCTGRKANTKGMGLEELGIERDHKGFLKVNEFGQTSVKGVYGAGDVIGEPMYVYTAAYEGALVAENAIKGKQRAFDYSVLPWVIFTDPQVAGIGMDEKEAQEKSIPFEVSKLPLTYVPRAIAARSTKGFIKILRNPETDLILGARILAPEGAELLMELAMAMKYNIPTKEVMSLFHPYLTLSEGIKLSLISFGKDINKLSCCAS